MYGVPRIDNPTYAELLTILRIHGYVAVEVGGRVNIVPDAIARSLPVRLLNRDDDSVPDDEVVMRVIATPNAVYLVAILRALDAAIRTLGGVRRPRQQRGRQADHAGSYANIRRMTELVSALSR